MADELASYANSNSLNTLSLALDTPPKLPCRLSPAESMITAREYSRGVSSMLLIPLSVVPNLPTKRRSDESGGVIGGRITVPGGCSDASCCCASFLVILTHPTFVCATKRSMTS
eukprot:scaffold10700_cov16-Prasinocladus_malaysianus.AAC.1